MVGRFCCAFKDLSIPEPKFLPVELNCWVLTLVLRISVLPEVSFCTAAEFVLREKMMD